MARNELTKSKATEYRQASKKRKGEMLDALCADTGWSRDHARKALKKALEHQKGKRGLGHRRAKKYSARARQVLINAWALSGSACGQYFVIQIEEGLLERLIKNKHLRDGRKNKGILVRAGDKALSEVRSMSSATIDRYLRDVKASLEPLSKSTTKKASSPLRNEIPFGRSYRSDKTPGYLSADTVAHCGNSLKGDHIWTLNATDVVLGWTETISIKNRARKWIIEGHNTILPQFPYEVKGINYDGGSEFINYEMVDYSNLHTYEMTRSRPYH